MRSSLSVRELVDRRVDDRRPAKPRAAEDVEAALRAARWPPKIEAEVDALLCDRSGAIALLAQWLVDHVVAARRRIADDNATIVCGAAPEHTVDLTRVGRRERAACLDRGGRHAARLVDTDLGVGTHPIAARLDPVWLDAPGQRPEDEDDRKPHTITVTQHQCNRSNPARCAALEHRSILVCRWLAGRRGEQRLQRDVRA